ncbi:sulfatase-like hydrolase/transferase, partial [bacterium]|nr:sulfatase-like hydrolase/transferase [bacterium]
SDCITDSTLAWLKTRDAGKPFFLMHHYKAPHDMFDNARRYDSYLEDVAIPEPESLWSQPDFGSIATRGHKDECVRYIGTSIGRRLVFRNYTRGWAKDPKLTDDQAKRLAYQTYLKKYLRCVKGVDDNLKRLFDYLKAEGLYDNTLILYTGDQGFMLGEHDYQDKRWMYDESQRMPFLVRYPKTVKAGSRTDAMVENIDYGPTMLDFAGVATPDYMQGRSFRSILETGKEPEDWKEGVYYRYWMHMAHHWNPSHFGIRTKTHKLIFYYGCNTKGGNQTPPGWELYDLKNDPHEVSNVYDDPDYAAVVKDLKARLAAMRKANGDTDEKFPEMKKVVDEFWEYDESARKRAEQISHDYAEACKARGNKRGKGPKGRAKKGWIEAKPSKVPLKKSGGYTEISRDAAYRMSHPGNAGFNLDNAYLTSGEDGKVKPHAFHCDENADQPHIVIRLNSERAVHSLYIRNRKGSLQERAKGLTVWFSKDGKTWMKVWQAKDVAAQWEVDLGKDIPARYVKVGLPGKGTLHLHKVVVFGK